MSEEQLTVEKIDEWVMNLESVITAANATGDSKTVCDMLADNAFKGVEATTFLLSKLATIERDTAEKCKQIAADREDDMSADYPSPGIDNRISRHFNLGEKP